MDSALDKATQRADELSVRPSARFSRAMPISVEQLAEWQRQIDAAVPVHDRKSRLVIRWEAGDPWQPIGRFILWQCVDPTFTAVEPWIVSELRSFEHPRAQGHYCGVGVNPDSGQEWCKCPLKRGRWHGGTHKHVDTATWELYKATGLYGSRWWTIQGNHGGHRFMWAPDELASTLSVVKGGPADTPAPGDLPFAPFDGRVLAAIEGERRAAKYIAALESLADRKTALTQEEQAEAEAIGRAVMAWSDDRVDALMDEGLDQLPRWLEDKYGRAPVGAKEMINHEAIERSFVGSE